MLLEIGLENFKAFGARQVAPLARITVIYGANSSGKSSIVQALQMVRQSIETRTDGYLIPRGAHANLGSFTQLVHRQDASQPVGISFRFLPVRHGMETVAFDGTFHSGWSSDDETKEFLALTTAQYKVTTPQGTFDFEVERSEADDEPGFQFMGVRGRRSLAKFLLNQRTATTQDEGDLADAEAVLPDRLLTDGFPFPLTFPNPESAIKADDVEWDAFEKIRRAASRMVMAESLDNHLKGLRRVFTRVFDDMLFLGPLRKPPERITPAHVDEIDHVGSKGEYTYQVLYENRGRLPLVNEWLEVLGVPYELGVEQLGDHVSGRLFAATLVDRRTGATVSPMDVGFGISQLLPIVVQGQIGQGMVLCVEQPEIHLHPRLQAELARFFALDRENQWLIETHSEALMLRLQRLIRDHELDPGDVSVLYVQRMGEGGSRIVHLPLDADGEFTREWPDGFFQEMSEED